MTNSRAKGARMERQWAKKCTDEGFPAIRAQQHKGAGDSPDVLCASLDAYFCEVKGRERLNVYDALQKATDEAEGKTPYVAWKKNHHDWLVIMWADDWFDLVRESL